METTKQNPETKQAEIEYGLLERHLKFVIIGFEKDIANLIMLRDDANEKREYFELLADDRGERLRRMGTQLATAEEERDDAKLAHRFEESKRRAHTDRADRARARTFEARQALKEQAQEIRDICEDRVQLRKDKNDLWEDYGDAIDALTDLVGGMGKEGNLFSDEGMAKARALIRTHEKRTS